MQYFAVSPIVHMDSTCIYLEENPLDWSPVHSSPLQSTLVHSSPLQSKCNDVIQHFKLSLKFDSLHNVVMLYTILTSLQLWALRTHL